ncbi:MAG: transposase [Candidatus Asgardarchaeia archaeon]
MEECYRIIRQTRWPEGVTCPHCGSKEVQKNGHTPKGAQKYHCKNCGKYFNDLTGTILHHHKLPINEAFYIIWSMPHKSTKLIAEELNRNYQAVQISSTKCRKQPETPKSGWKTLSKLTKFTRTLAVKALKKESQTERQAQTWQGDCKVRKTAGGDSRSPKNRTHPLSCL